MTPEKAHALALAKYDTCQEFGRKYGYFARRAAPDPDDLAQEAYIAYYRSALKCTDSRNYGFYGGRFAKWRIFQSIALTKGAVRVPTTAYRTSKDKPEVIAATSEVETVGQWIKQLAEPAPPDPLELEEQRDTLNSLLGRLSERQRQVITLVYGLGCEPRPASTAAQELGVSKQNVCQLLQHSIKRMSGPQAVRA